MDNLIKTFLFFSFLFFGAGTTALAIGTSFAFHIITVTYLSLFAFISLITYSFYGFFGFVYMFFASFALLGTVFMYWYDLSFDDIGKKLEKFQTIVGQNKNHVSSTELRTKLYNAVSQRTGMNEQHIQRVKNVYQTVSKFYDKFVAFLFVYLGKFRSVTQNVKGLKQLYSGYDTLCNVVPFVESAKNVHKLASSMPVFDQNFDISRLMNQFENTVENDDERLFNVDELNNEINDEDNVEQLDTDEKIQLVEENEENEENDDSTNVKEENTVVNRKNKKDTKHDSPFGNFNLGEMQKQLNRMTPQQKNQMNQMTNNLMNNLNLNDMMGMMKNFQSFNNGPQKHTVKNNSN